MKTYSLILAISLLFVSFAFSGRINESKVREITNQYIESIMEQNFNKWSKLMLNTGEWDEEKFKKHLQKCSIEDISITTIERTRKGYDISIATDQRIPSGDGYYTASDMHWIQMTTDGSIKYELFTTHPIPQAMVTCHVAIGYAKKGRAYKGSSNIKNYGIPIFEYDSEDPISDQLDSFEDIRDWLLGQGEDWDLGDPKLPCPSACYKRHERGLDQ